MEYNIKNRCIYIIIIPCIIGGPIIMAVFDLIIGIVLFLLSIIGLLYIVVIARNLRKYKFECGRFNLILLNNKIIELNNKYFGSGSGIDFIIELEREHKPVTEYLKTEK